MTARRLAAVMAFALALPIPGPAAEEASVIDARIMEVTGEVTLYASAAEGVAAEKDVALEEGDRLTTGPGASAEISLDGDSLVTISENSDFTFKSAQRSATAFELSLGSLLAKIKKLARSDSLEVRSPTAVAAVRGTEFGVEVGADQETHVGVFDEGSVSVRGQQGPESVLQANQETSVRRGMAPERAYALRRMMRRRAFMRRAMRQRMRILAERWKELPREQRLQRRQQFLERVKERRQLMRQRMEQRRQRMERRRRGDGEKRR